IRALGAQKADMERILRESDIISLHAPSIPETRHMINADTLAQMKDNVILINTARGSLIDEAALYAHMAAGKIKYACLDVTDPEPPAVDNPLRTLPNCIITPHLAGQANNGLGRIGVHVCEEIMRCLGNEPLATRVTREMLSTMA
ncbi:MAG: NAD(P)-dependent oxidoreductase, partial [Eubacteriales bacterium]|nr:NAD(P)-dependent oxidoreductase [Eubacteriales bacterium]